MHNVHLPFSVHPNLVVLPFAVGLALVVGVMTATFKKYLEHTIG